MQCSSLVKTNLLSLLDQLEMSMKNNAPFNPTRQLVTTINEDLEALESIYQCGLTQERISNDVLSLGRIQLEMLRTYHFYNCDTMGSIADKKEMFDVETDLQNEAQKVISIFQNEARMKRISLSMAIGESIERLGVHAVKTDPVRLGQVYVLILPDP
jgi:signal transduction histidine kinase